MNMSPTAELTNFLGCRISTEDRLKAEELKNKFELRNNSELLRLLIHRSAEQLGVD